MTSNHSSACCTTVAAAENVDYKEQGQWERIVDKRTYTTGHYKSSKGILLIYDVFGYTFQTIQGADILGQSKLQPIVIVPDFFMDDSLKVEWYESQTEENRQHIQAFMTRRADPRPIVEDILDTDGIMTALKRAYPAVESWAIIGYCWGGKIAALTSADETPFKVAVQTSPALLDATDADKVQIPMAILASKDENAETVSHYNEKLQHGKHVETWVDSKHGWMSARANLANPEERREYERGYQVVVDFLEKYL